MGEVPVYDTWDQDEGTTFLRGVVDALVVDATKNVEVVVDWKSDVDPDERRISLYCEQMREYLVAAKAKCGLLVFLSSGKVIRLERDFSNGPWNDATP
jgi:ATP-dependent exoDNAse (exonuclease V) beta subunit